MLRLPLLLAALCLGGCYGVAQVGYGNGLPFDLARHRKLSAGEAELGFNGGLGDLREERDRVAPELGVRLEGGAPGQIRAELGLGLLLLQQPGWSHSWTPTLRLQAPVGLQWRAGGTAVVFSPGVELGVVLFGGQGTRQRSLITLGLGVSDHLELGTENHLPVLELRLGFGDSTSIGPLS